MARRRPIQDTQYGSERVRELAIAESRKYYYENRDRILRRRRQRYARSGEGQRVRVYRQENAQQMKETRRSYLEKNKDRIRDQRRIYRAKHRREIQDSRFRRLYGIGLSEYKSLYEAQKGRCAICPKVPPGKLHVDHDHKTGKVRGLLCSSCNRGIGFLRDDVELLRGAAAYLQRAAMQTQEPSNVIPLRRTNAAL